MGTYTELHCDLKFKKDTPTEVIEAIKFMAIETSVYKDVSEISKVFKGVEIFQCESVRILNCNSVGLGTEFIESYSNFSMPYCNFYYDDTIKQWVLKCISNFKDYENNIHKFFSWVVPYVDSEDQKAIGYGLGEYCPSNRRYYRKSKNDGSIETINSNKYIDTSGIEDKLYRIKQMSLFGEESIEMTTTDIDELVREYAELTSRVYNGFSCCDNVLQVFKDYSLIFEYRDEVSDISKFKNMLLKL